MIGSRTTMALLALAAAIIPACADEGMWTFNNFPSDRVEKAYGFRPDQKWLDHVRLSSARLAGGCSGAFVSPMGLVQTNHHCARDCVQQLSTQTNDLIANGFLARELGDEIVCPDVEINQLVEIIDVTERIRKATAGLDGEPFVKALNAEQSAITRACAGDDANVRCDVVTLYQGGIYNLYKYRRYQDVRLVFAPEESIAFFGGDPDNFEFPRYNLDLAYMRVYSNGAPLDTRTHYLRYAKADAKPGDLTFTSGHPGSTHRLETVAELEFRRDVGLPRDIFFSSELRGLLMAFSARGPEQARIARGALWSVENSLKASKGVFAALVDPAIIRNRAAVEAALRAKVNADPALQREYGGAWDMIRAARDYQRTVRDRFDYTEGGRGFRSRLFRIARTLTRFASEIPKADDQRLPEFSEARLPQLRQGMLSTAPVYPELEKLTLTFSLSKLREALGADNPLVKKILGQKSPAQLASELIDGTKLGSPDVRAKLLAGGPAAIEASTDPMIVFFRSLDSDFRAVRKNFESNVEAPLVKGHGLLAQVTFKMYGTSNYPDATFTLRLSYGSVQGYRQAGSTVEPMTTFGGLFERATGSEPFELPASWIAARSALNMSQPFNFVTTNDIVGGNSGSPTINRAGEVVGLVFDGNIQSLGGDFGYDPEVNRAVSVNVGAIRESLAKVYRADRLLRELSN